MKILNKSPWDFTLFEENDAIYLEVVCGSVGIYELKIQLTQDEIASSRNDQNFISQLAKKIRFDPDSYQNRIIKN